MNAAYLTHVHDAASSHGATSSGGSLLFALTTVGLLLVAFAVVVYVCVRWDHGGSDDEDGGPGWGGGGSRPSGPDGPREPGGEPAWWPEFERQFAAWVESRALALQ
jgi:hypothetical protein